MRLIVRVVGPAGRVTYLRLVECDDIRDASSFEAAAAGWTIAYQYARAPGIHCDVIDADDPEAKVSDE